MKIIVSKIKKSILRPRSVNLTKKEFSILQENSDKLLQLCSDFKFKGRKKADLNKFIIDITYVSKRYIIV